MRYRNHIQDMGHGRTFAIIVDDRSLTWVSEPVGNDISTPMTLYFTQEGGGPIGSGKQFEVLPGGGARQVK